MAGKVTKIVPNFGEIINLPEVMSAIFANVKSEQSTDFISVLSSGDMSSPLNTAILGICQHVGLRSSESEVIQNGMIVVTYMAVAEISQHLLGIGTGLAKIDFNGKHR